MQYTHLIFSQERRAPTYVRWRCGVLDRGAGWMFSSTYLPAIGGVHEKIGMAVGLAM